MPANRFDLHNRKKKQRQAVKLLILFLILTGVSILLVNQFFGESASSNESHSPTLIESNPNPAALNQFASYVVNVQDNGNVGQKLVAELPTATEVIPPTPTESTESNGTDHSQIESGVAFDENDVNNPVTLAFFETAVSVAPSPTPFSDILILSPVADAFVSSQSATDNFGRLSTLDLEADPAKHGYLRFEIPQLPAFVSDGILRLRLNDVNSEEVALFAVTENEWEEVAITFNNAPQMDDLLWTSRGGRANSWIEFDVTELITQSGLISFGLKTSGKTGFEFLSRESDYPPELILIFGEEAEPTPELTPLTPTLAATIEATATAPPPTETSTPTHPPAVPTATPTDPPVFIQPTPTEISVPISETITKTAVADTFVNVLQPNTNYGTLNYMSLDASPTKYGLIRFDLESFNGTVDKAILRIYSHDGLDEGIKIFDIEDDSWIEDDVTFNTVPSFGALIGEVNHVQLNSWVEIELSTAVIKSGLVSIGLSSSTTGSLELSTRETTRVPQLILSIVDYEPVLPPSPPPEPEPPTHCLASPGNILTNGEFLTDTSNWSFYSDGTAHLETAVPDPTYCDSVAQFTITNEGTNVQIYQSGLTLNGDTSYTLRFAAKSNSGNDMSIYLQKHEPNYKSYGLNGEVINLTTEWQLFEIVFTTDNFSGQVNNGRLRFWFAPFDQAGDVYWIDHVELIEN